MIMSDMPAPETTEAFLVPDLRDRHRNALPARRVTLHRYSHTEEYKMLPVQDGGRWRDDLAFRHIFVCTETGAERVYGCEGPNSPGMADDSEEN